VESGKGADGDYAAAREAIECFNILGLRGAVYYIRHNPVGWCLGEPLAKGKMFAIHFEKAIDSYKGIYQFINQAFAQSLPKHYLLINREQDLGDLGLRQAKMTYRPVGFVKNTLSSVLGYLILFQHRSSPLRSAALVLSMRAMKIDGAKIHGSKPKSILIAPDPRMTQTPLI